MKKSKNVRKLNNRGMSLIEILVAIVILGIVTSSLLHSFVTSVRLNAKSKEQQRVSTAAQSLMEGLKAYDVEHICLQFNGGGMHLIGNVESYKEQPRSDRDGDGVYDVSILLNGDGSYTFLPAADNSYTFTLEKIKFDNIAGMNDEYYDAQIDISPNTVWNDSLSADEKSMIDVVDINEYLDAVYRQALANIDQQVYSQIMGELVDKLNEMLEDSEGDLDEEDEEEGDDADVDGAIEAYDLSNLESRGILAVKKTTTVTITESSDPSAGLRIDKVTVEVKYEYKYEDSEYSLGILEGTKYVLEEGISDDPTMDTVYDSTGTAAAGAHLENVYLFYYPAYQNGMHLEETIIINNNTVSDKDVYLIKQVNAGLSHGNLMSCENTYGVTVNVGNEGLSTGKVNLYHNLGDDLANPGSTLSNGHLLHIGGGALGTVNAETVTSTEKVLLYNVTISIYAHPDAGDEEFELEPGRYFPTQRLLLELNGTMND